MKSDIPLTRQEAAQIFVAEIRLQVPTRCREHRGDIPSKRLGSERTEKPRYGNGDIQNVVGMEMWALWTQWAHMFGDVIRQPDGTITIENATLKGNMVFRMASHEAMKWLRENPWQSPLKKPPPASPPPIAQPSLFATPPR